MAKSKSYGGSAKLTFGTRKGGSDKKSYNKNNPRSKKHRVGKENRNE